MSRFLALSLALGLLSTAVRAANPVFGAYGTRECDACLDAAYQSCDGDYQTRPFAECICAGDGGTNFVACLPYCDGGINEPAIATAAWYGYCVIFFKELCPSAQEYMYEDTYAEQCSDEAIAAGGLGEEKSTTSDDDKDDKGSSGTPGSSSKDTTSDDKDSKGTQNSTDNEENSAASTAVPTLAIIAALAVSLMYA